MNNTFIARFLRNALWIIACIMTVLLFGMNFFVTADVTYDTWEQVTLHSHLLPSLLMLVVTILLMLGLSFVNGLSTKISEKKLFLGFSIFYAVVAFYLILNTDSSLGADPQFVYNAAQNVLNGNFSDLATEGYIHRYPHQLGLMVYDTILALFSKSTLANFFANFLFVLGINYYTYKISDQLFKNHTVNLMTIITCFAFLPQVIFILFAYGLIPGFFFMTLAFYNGIKFADEYKIRHLIGLVIGSICAVLMKNNYMIGVIAIIIYLILKLCNKEFNWKSPVAIVLLALSLFLPHKIIASAYEAYTGADLDNGAPAILWLAMGTNLDNHMRAAGWYDGTNWNIYNDSLYDKEIAQYYGEEMMKENIAKMQNDPAATWEFFKEKNLTQWCEPMYQCVFVSSKTPQIYESYPPLLQSLYNAQAADETVTYLAKYITLIVYAFAAVFFIFFRKKCVGWEPLIAFTIGGFIFHTFWEAKSQYVHSYMFVLIPLAMFALWSVITKFKDWKNSL